MSKIKVSAFINVKYQITNAKSNPKSKGGKNMIRENENWEVQKEQLPKPKYQEYNLKDIIDGKIDINLNEVPFGCVNRLNSKLAEEKVVQILGDPDKEGGMDIYNQDLINSLIEGLEKNNLIALIIPSRGGKTTILRKLEELIPNSQYIDMQYSNNIRIENALNAIKEDTHIVLVDEIGQSYRTDPTGDILIKTLRNKGLKVIFGFGGAVSNASRIRDVQDISASVNEHIEIKEGSLKPLNPDQVEEFVTNWCASKVDLSDPNVAKITKQNIIALKEASKSIPFFHILLQQPTLSSASS